MLRKKGPLVLAACMFLIAGCSRNTNKEVKVGVLMPLTGSAASLGVPAWQAIQLAMDEENALRTKNEPVVRLLPEDTQAQPSTGVSSILRLITTDDVKLIIGPLTSTVTLAVAPIAEERHVVIISPGASAPSISSAGDYIFRNELSDSIGGTYQADIAYDKLHFKRVGCVYINTDYGAGLYQVFKSRFEKLGGKIPLAESFLPGTTDFRSIIAKLKSVHVDAVFIIAIDEIVNFVRQKEELGLNCKIYTTPIFENQEYLGQLGNLAQGILYVYYGTYDPTSTDSATQAFISHFEARFYHPPTYYSALAYDAARILYDALKEANFDQARVKDQLYQIRGFKGITGETSFDKNGDVIKPVSLKTVESGRFVFVR